MDDSPTTCDDLPEECWELILNRLNSDHNNSHFQSLSLVSTRLLSLTDRLRRRFTAVDQTFIIHGTISKLLRRFTDLKTLDLSQLTIHAHFEASLLEISRPDSLLLRLESLDVSNQKFLPIRFLEEFGPRIANLKVLRCAKLSRLSDDDLVAVANSFSDLEEFDISYPRNLVDFSGQSGAGVTDGGIEFLCSKLKSLRKIDISGNHFLTCKSVVALSSNCLRLTDISMLDCPFITLNGVRFMLRNSLELNSVSMSTMECLSGSSLLFVESANDYGRCLSSLDFQYSDVSDEFLVSIAKACLPLKRISLSCCTGYTYDGISSLLGTYHRCLEFLDLTGNGFLTDESMIGLVQHLHRLVAIKLNFCSRLTDATLSAVIKNCPFLQDVEMKATSVGKDGGNTFMGNPSINSVSLACNLYLNDACLIKIGLVSRNLQRLDVSLCPGITGYSIGEIGRSCPEIRHLSLNDCKGVKNIMLSQELPKLESLLAARSGMSDEGLEIIGKKCGGILELGLAGCLNVTNYGVKSVVRCCRKLRKIDLKGCRGVDKSIVDWIVFTRPSVKKLTPPCYDATTGNQRKLLLRHGCHVCDL